MRSKFGFCVHFDVISVFVYIRCLSAIFFSKPLADFLVISLAHAIELVSKSGRFMVDFHTDFWEQKLSKTPSHYFSNGEIRKIKNVLLESYIIDDIKSLGWSNGRMLST